MRRFMDEMDAMFPFAAMAVVWLVTTVVVTLAGPFGTYDALGLAPRTTYWASVVGLALPVSVAVRVILRRWFPAWGRVCLSLVSAMAAGIVLSAPVHWISHLFDGDHVHPLPPMLEMTGLVVIVAVGISLIRLVLTWVVQRAFQQERRARLLDRVEPAARGRIRHLSVRDHYVVVRTDRGEDSVLMRFSDALEEIGGLRGLQVHRSHWVAEDAVVSVRRDGTRTFLRLDDGTEVPVSRSYQAEVEARSWPRPRPRAGMTFRCAPQSTATALSPIRVDSGGRSDSRPPV